MKTSILIFAFILTFPFLVASFTLAQEVKGNGKVAKQSHQISSFDRIELNGVYNTIIRQAGSESVVIETDENLLNYIKPEVNDRTLRIEQKEGVNFKEMSKLNVYITFKDVNAITNNGVGNIKSDGPIDLSELSISCNGVGNLELNLKCSGLNIDMSSVGNIELEGKVAQADFQVSGVGNIDAEDLKIEKLKIENSGIGNAKVYVTGEIQPTVSGAGNIRCKGNPRVTNLQQDGIGRFKLD